MAGGRIGEALNRAGAGNGKAALPRLPGAPRVLSDQVRSRMRLKKVRGPPRAGPRGAGRAGAAGPGPGRCIVRAPAQRATAQGLAMHSPQCAGRSGCVLAVLKTLIAADSGRWCRGRRAPVLAPRLPSHHFPFDRCLTVCPLATSPGNHKTSWSCYTSGARRRCSAGVEWKVQGLKKTCWLRNWRCCPE
jgi:hypothetical protein